MADVKKFRIRKKGLLAGSYDGFDFKDGNIVKQPKTEYCSYISKTLDSYTNGSEWGRLVINGELPKESEYVVYTLAQDYDIINYNNKTYNLSEFIADKQIPSAEKFNAFKLAGAQINNNADDILIFNQNGRYFIFGIQVFSREPVKFLEFDVMFPRETLMQYLPEVYSAEGGDFFKRYMSIFGSIIYDKKEQIGKLPDYLNIDKTPTDILPMFARWLGVNCDISFLEPEQIRKLLKMARNLSAYKGSKQVLEDIAELYLGERPIIVEQFKWQSYSGIEQQANCQDIYGTKSNEFTVLIKNKINETTFLHFKNLLDMFSPLKTKARIICLDKESQLDRYTYMDINAKLIDKPFSTLCDKNQTFDSDFILG